MDTNNKIHVLDLHFLDTPTAIGSFLIESSEGPVLIETGPETTFEHLKQAVENKGFSWKNIHNVLLTHIHFDHAGAAWKLAQNGAKIHVHPIGLPHLQNPEKLWNSAKMIYKEDMERLWGAMQPIDEKLLIPADDGDILNIGNLEFKVHYTPGHAIHHNAYQLENVIFSGDVAGVRIHGGIPVPPCPPPDIDLYAWKNSIEKLRKLNPEVIYLTHFGPIEDVAYHLNALEDNLNDWAAWMKPHYDAGNSVEEITPKFMEYTKQQQRQAGASEEHIDQYEKANPSWMSVAGLLRYWKLKEQGRLQ